MTQCELDSASGFGALG